MGFYRLSPCPIESTMIPPMQFPNKTFLRPVEHKATAFCTFTLLPALYNQTARMQFKKTYSMLISRLKANTLKYFVVVELSKDGNVHYHASCSFDDDISPMLLTDSLKGSKVFGRSEIDFKHVQDDARFDYMTKTLRSVYQVINNKKTQIFVPWEYWVKPSVERAEAKQIKVDKLDSNTDICNEFDEVLSSCGPCFELINKLNK